MGRGLRRRLEPRRLAWTRRRRDGAAATTASAAAATYAHRQPKGIATAGSATPASQAPIEAGLRAEGEAVPPALDGAAQELLTARPPIAFQVRRWSGSRSGPTQTARPGRRRRTSRVGAAPSTIRAAPRSSRPDAGGRQAGHTGQVKIATASPSVESPKPKSWRIRGARLAVRNPGSTPATISAVPGTTDRRGPRLRNDGGCVQVPERVRPRNGPSGDPASVNVCQSAPASDPGATSSSASRTRAAPESGSRRSIRPVCGRARWPSLQRAPAPRAYGPVRQTATRSEVTSSIWVPGPARCSRSARTRAAQLGELSTSRSSGEITHHQAFAAFRAYPGRRICPRVHVRDRRRGVAHLELAGARDVRESGGRAADGDLGRQGAEIGRHRPASRSVIWAPGPSGPHPVG